MRNVLIAFDGSASAHRALQYVIDFAKEHKASLEVHVLNVQQEPVMFGEYVTVEMIDQMTQGFLSKGSEIVKEASNYVESAGLSCKTHVMLGNVPEKVRETVTQLGCDTVVMGTRGLGSLKGLLLGSVATQVIHEVPVPVVLVK
ncbi:nucleotide-binding universal stress UspA family protein [Azomonas agilis]|uniref:Nucleotide-binding universal stress UspA family protein n=1 Tax=Azomonas agilis TaxID=116849 RepID=A0A562I1H5_9GAMM|nr:universal stress protein [Azomonas agilis]TWH64897.1 nucleotide-binding universal stress UspA family protein [Azomonas agilis]